MLLLCFLLSGCTGYREIDRGYFVTAIAFSKKDTSTTVYIEALSSSDITEEKDKKILLKGIGKNVGEAFDNLKNSLIKPLYFEHLGVAIFEDVSYNDISFLENISDINNDLYIVKTDDANALLKNDTFGGTIGYDIVSLIKHKEKEIGKKFSNRLYNIQNTTAPNVNFSLGKLVLTLQGEQK